MVKGGSPIENENIGCNVVGFDHFKSETLAEMKTVKHKDLKDMLFKMDLTIDENVDILDIKYFTGSTIGYILPPG